MSEEKTQSHIPMTLSSNLDCTAALLPGRPQAGVAGGVPRRARKSGRANLEARDTSQVIRRRLELCVGRNVGGVLLRRQEAPASTTESRLTCENPRSSQGVRTAEPRVERSSARDRLDQTVTGLGPRQIGARHRNQARGQPARPVAPTSPPRGTDRQ